MDKQVYFLGIGLFLVLVYAVLDKRTVLAVSLLVILSAICGYHLGYFVGYGAGLDYMTEGR